MAGFNSFGVGAMGCCCGSSPPPPTVPCGPCNIPTTLFVTDSFTTLPVVWQGTGSTIWFGCYLLPVSNGISICDACSGLPADPPSAGETLITYSIQFAGTESTCELTVVRSWIPSTSVQNLEDGTNYCGYCIQGGTLNPDCTMTTVTCPECAPPAPHSCVPGVTDSNDPGPVDCSVPLAISVTLGLGSFSNGGCDPIVTPSPLGADITITADGP
jgi:hypothetical protein